MDNAGGKGRKRHIFDPMTGRKGQLPYDKIMAEHRCTCSSNPGIHYPENIFREEHHHRGVDILSTHGKTD